jgi:hypothetical protein
MDWEKQLKALVGISGLPEILLTGYLLSKQQIWNSSKQMFRLYFTKSHGWLVVLCPWNTAITNMKKKEKKRLMQTYSGNTTRNNFSNCDKPAKTPNSLFAVCCGLSDTAVGTCVPTQRLRINCYRWQSNAVRTNALFVLSSMTQESTYVEKCIASWWKGTGVNTAHNKKEMPFVTAFSWLFLFCQPRKSSISTVHSPQWARASSLSRLYYHTQIHHTR